MTERTQTAIDALCEFYGFIGPHEFISDMSADTFPHACENYVTYLTTPGKVPDEIENIQEQIKFITAEIEADPTDTDFIMCRDLAVIALDALKAISDPCEL